MAAHLTLDWLKDKVLWARGHIHHVHHGSNSQSVYVFVYINRYIEKAEKQEVLFVTFLCKTWTISIVIIQNSHWFTLAGQSLIWFGPSWRKDFYGSSWIHTVVHCLLSTDCRIYFESWVIPKSSFTSDIYDFSNLRTLKRQVKGVCKFIYLVLAFYGQSLALRNMVIFLLHTLGGSHWKGHTNNYFGYSRKATGRTTTKKAIFLHC